MPLDTAANALTGDHEALDTVESRRLAAKQPVSLAAGRYGQPWYPLLVTIPIGAWVISFAFDLAAHTANEEFVYARAAFWLIGVGIIGAFAAAVPAVLDQLTIARGTPAYRTGVRHLVLGDIALVLFIVSFLLRRGDDSLQAATTPVMALSVVALVALGASRLAWPAPHLPVRRARGRRGDTARGLRARRRQRPRHPDRTHPRRHRRRRGHRMSTTEVRFPITFDDDANELLAEDPLALLFGMLLDQQVPMTWAFKSPIVIQGAPRRRAGRPRASPPWTPTRSSRSSARSRPCTATRRPWPSGPTPSPCTSSSTTTATPPTIWTSARSGAELYKRVSALPGFGEEKTQIFVALLAKRFDVKPRGWKAAAGAFSDNQPRSAADVDSMAKLREVQAWKKAQKAAKKSKSEFSL